MSMSMRGHAISLGSGAIIEMENKCDQFGEHAGFARAWKRERERETKNIEPRESFLMRLRRTAHWLKERQKDAAQLCTNQKVRAREVEELAGSRTKW